MTFEDRLASIDASLKSLVTIFSTAASAPAALGATLIMAGTASDTAGDAKPTAEKNTRAKKTTAAAQTADEPVLPGDAPGTQYWMSADNSEFYKSAAGEQPAVKGLNKVSAAYFSAHKDKALQGDQVGNSSDAAAANSTADTAPTATPQADAAASSSANVTVTFKDTVKALTVLSKTAGPGLGKEGVVAVLNEYLPELPQADRKVPKLEPLGKNAEVVLKVAGMLPADALKADAELTTLVDSLRGAAPAAAAADEDLFV